MLLSESRFYFIHNTGHVLCKVYLCQEKLIEYLPCGEYILSIGGIKMSEYLHEYKHR